MSQGARVLAPLHRQLGMELRRLREAAGKTQHDAGEFTARVRGGELG